MAKKTVEIHEAPRVVKRGNLETATALTTLTAGAIVGDGGDILDAADGHASTGKSTHGGLGTGSGGLGLGATGGTELDVEGGDAEVLKTGGNVLGGKHGSVGGRLIAISLDLHTTGDADEGLAAGDISDMDEGVVEGGEDVGHGKEVLVLTAVGAEGRLLLDGGALLLDAGHLAAACGC